MGFVALIAIIASGQFGIYRERIGKPLEAPVAWALGLIAGAIAGGVITYMVMSL